LSNFADTHTTQETNPVKNVTFLIEVISVILVITIDCIVFTMTLYFVLYNLRIL